MNSIQKIHGFLIAIPNGQQALLIGVMTCSTPCRTIFLSLNKMVSTVYQCDIDIKSIKVVPVIKSG